MSKEKGKSFWEDIKDSAKKPFKSRKKKSKKPSKTCNVTALYSKMPVRLFDIPGGFNTLANGQWPGSN